MNILALKKHGRYFECHFDTFPDRIHYTRGCAASSASVCLLLPFATLVSRLSCRAADKVRDVQRVVAARLDRHVVRVAHVHELYGRRHGHLDGSGGGRRALRGRLVAAAGALVLLAAARRARLLHPARPRARQSTCARPPSPDPSRRAPFCSSSSSLLFTSTAVYSYVPLLFTSALLVRLRLRLRLCSLPLRDR